jgi:hypothetical protein
MDTVKSNKEQLNTEELNTEKSLDEWESSDEEILKEWSDKALCYRWLYEQSYHKYNILSLWFTIPVIVLSTITGTANFAQDRIPEEHRGIFAMVIGGLNIFAGILTTVSQFLKISQLKEEFNIALKSWDKFNRTLKLELMKKPSERSPKEDFINNAKQEYDRLVDESPILPPDIIVKFNKIFKNNNTNLIIPEICDSLLETRIYKDEDKNIQLNKQTKIDEIV